jgi:Ni2+-binding GTPase involved in maturation of urease and hydrogenase
MIDPKEKMPNLRVDCLVLLGKTYVLVETPMGSGKTYQLERLLDRLDTTVELKAYRVIVFPQGVLSIQKAEKLVIGC